MQRHRIPYEFKFEDKIVGGILTWKQVLILCAPLAVAIKVFVDFHVPAIISVFAGIIILACSVAFAFVKVNGDELAVFLNKYFDFLRRQKIFLNREE